MRHGQEHANVRVCEASLYQTAKRLADTFKKAATGKKPCVSLDVEGALVINQPLLPPDETRKVYISSGEGRDVNLASALEVLVRYEAWVLQQKDPDHRPTPWKTASESALAAFFRAIAPQKQWEALVRGFRDARRTIIACGHYGPGKELVPLVSPTGQSLSVVLAGWVEELDRGDLVLAHYGIANLVHSYSILQLIALVAPKVGGEVVRLVKKADPNVTFCWRVVAAEEYANEASKLAVAMAEAPLNSKEHYALAPKALESLCARMRNLEADSKDASPEDVTAVAEVFLRAQLAIAVSKFDVKKLNVEKLVKKLDQLLPQTQEAPGPDGAAASAAAASAARPRRSPTRSLPRP